MEEAFSAMVDKKGGIWYTYNCKELCPIKRLFMKEWSSLMKNMRKTTFIILNVIAFSFLALVIFIVASVYLNNATGYEPPHQPMTKWENDKFQLYVSDFSEDDLCHGLLIFTGGSEEIIYDVTFELPCEIVVMSHRESAEETTEKIVSYNMKNSSETKCKLNNVTIHNKDLGEIFPETMVIELTATEIDKEDFPLDIQEK